MQKLIDKYVPNHQAYTISADVAERYYNNHNDVETGHKSADKTNPLRNADNRISHNFYQILVDQTAGYMFTYPPTLGTDNDELNRLINRTLGDNYNKVCKDLSIDASNNSNAWLHVWVDKSNRFKYAVVDGRQIVPIYTGALDKELKVVLRVYELVEDSSNMYTVYEYWNDTECLSYRKDKNGTLNEFQVFGVTNMDLQTTSFTNSLKHGWGEVPFICFNNNNKGQNDLSNVKKLIDVYDKVMSGYINDIEDIQQVIFILEGYGGTNLEEFLGELKRYKTINTYNDPQSKSDVRTLSIEIPVEARNKLSEIVERNIYKLGQGVDINTDKLGNIKGVVIDHLYGFLELKAGLKETEFRGGFGKLIRFILKFLKLNADIDINQTWQRNKIRDDYELAQTISLLAPYTSKQNIAKANPLVEDWSEELKLKAADEKLAMQNFIEESGGVHNGVEKTTREWGYKL